MFEMIDTLNFRVCNLTVPPELFVKETSKVVRYKLGTYTIETAKYYPVSRFVGSLSSRFSCSSYSAPGPEWMRRVLLAALTLRGSASRSVSRPTAISSGSSCLLLRCSEVATARRRLEGLEALAATTTGTDLDRYTCH